MIFLIIVIDYDNINDHFTGVFSDSLSFFRELSHRYQ